MSNKEVSMFSKDDIIEILAFTVFMETLTIITILTVAYIMTK